jgi:hypothetical protein
MSNKKQSSVEWLISQLDKYYVLSYNELKNNEAVQQAKAMHKEEIINALHYFGIENVEQYYNETFNSDEA